MPAANAKIVDSEVVSPPELSPAFTGADVRRISLLDTMKAHYKTEKRVRVKVRADHDVPVQVNGYTFVIQPNVNVDVPESIAKILEEADYI